MEQLNALETALRAPPSPFRASMAAFGLAMLQNAVLGLTIGLGIGVGIALAG